MHRMSAVFQLVLCCQADNDEQKQYAGITINVPLQILMLNIKCHKTAELVFDHVSKTETQRKSNNNHVLEVNTISNS